MGDYYGRRDLLNGDSLYSGEWVHWELIGDPIHVRVFRPIKMPIRTSLVRRLAERGPARGTVQPSSTPRAMDRSPEDSDG